MRFRPYKMYPGALLAQECCSYQALTELLARIRGSLVVLIHSDRDCSNVIPKERQWAVKTEHPYKFLCTNLSQDEIVAGQGNSKLRTAIEVIHREWNPELILVLSTCPTVMIADNMKNVCREAARQLDANIVGQITHGLKPKSPAEVVDQLFVLLAESNRPSTADVEGRVNLVGFGLTNAEEREVRAVLGALNITVNAVLNAQSELSEFQKLSEAAFNIHPGPNMLLGFDAFCERELAIKPIEVPLPFGLSGADRFYEAICSAVSVDPSLLAATVEADRGKAVSALEAFRASYAGRPPLRVAFNIGSCRSFDLRRIALEELGQKPLLDDLEGSITLFIQGPAHEANETRVAEVLEALNVSNRFVLFSDPGQLDRYIVPNEFDFFLGEKFLRNQLSNLNLNCVGKNELRMGYRAIPSNLEVIEAAVKDTFYSLFDLAESRGTDEAAEKHQQQRRPENVDQSGR